jgi:energy-coupling factor transport system substrate-specific component
MLTKEPPTSTEERGLNKIGVKVGTYRYTTMDILLIAVIAAVGGVVNAYAVGAWAKFIEAAAGPFGAALDNPFYIFWVIIAVLLIPKPGVAIVTSMLAGIIEVLAGSEDGSVVLVFTLLQGVGIELGFLIWRYRSQLPAALLGGALCGVGCAICLTWIFGFDKFGAGLQILLILALAAADAVIGGILAYIIARGVARAGNIGPGRGGYVRAD